MNNLIKQILLSLCLFAATNAQEWIDQSITLSINNRFIEAESLLLGLMVKGDSSIDVNFYYASVLNSKMTHYENKLDEEPFLEALNKMIVQGERELENEKVKPANKAKILFYMGSAYGYLGFFQGQNGKWFSALKNGNRAKDFLQRAIEMDSTLWDAYLGLGAYKYWVSTKISWIPLIPDERDEGIALIKKTISNKGHSQYMAMHQLIYILLDYGRFDEAQQFAEIIVQKFPQSTFMRWAHSHVYMKKKDLPAAIDSYKQLLQLIDNDPQPNPNHRLVCLARLGDMYARSDSCTSAIKVIQQIQKFAEKEELDDEVVRLVTEISDRCLQ